MRKRTKRFLQAIGLSLVVAAAPVLAQGDGDIGIVFLHGKWGKPGGLIAPLVDSLPGKVILKTVEVNANHVKAPAAAVKEVGAWLRTLR